MRRRRGLKSAISKLLCEGWAANTHILSGRRRFTRPRRSRRDSGFVVCRACSIVWRRKSCTQPDGGEGLAMRKGYRREAGSEGSVEQTCELMDKNRIQGASVGRAGNVPRSPFPSRTQGVDSAVVHGRRLNLPQEICLMLPRRLGWSKGQLIMRQKSAEGVLPGSGEGPNERTGK